MVATKEDAVAAVATATVPELSDAWNVAGWTARLNALMEGEDAAQMRAFYRALLVHYPTSSVLWYCWMQHEYRHGNYEELEALFAEALRPQGDVRMWRLYLQYVRTCNAPAEGEAAEAVQTKRQTIVKAFELALTHIGLDVHALPVYKEYVDFVRSWTTQSLYEQQVQMDQVRKIYQKALATPIDGIESLWHDYDAYENGLNKLTAKKVLADRSAAYMAARAAAKELKELVQPLDREEYALPPSADAQLAAQKCSQWLRWIQWEKSNPLVIPDKATLLHQRIVFAYRCCLGVLRHYPEVWFDYSRYLVSINKRDDAEALLKSAIEVLSTDLLVNFAYCDLLESSEVEGRPIEARAVYEALLASLQTLIDASQATTAEEAASPPSGPPPSGAPSLIQDLTLVLVQYMNFSRRVEGINAARAIFTRARKLVHITHHIFLAAAKMEYFCKRDPVVAGKIFELGMSRFAASGEYVLDYLQHLIQCNDEQNARALFERSILSVPPGAVAMEIWKTYLDYVFRYGETASIRLLSRRFQEAYPEQVISEEISVFLRQYSYEDAAPSGERIWTLLQSGDRGDRRDRGERGDRGDRGDRGLTLLQKTHPTTPATATAIATTLSSHKNMSSSSLPKPFNVPDFILDLCGRLPAAAVYDGPRINFDGIVRLLQVVRLSPDPVSGGGLMAPPPFAHGMHPVSSSSASSKTNKNADRSTGGVTRPTRNGRTKRRRDRLDDGDERAEPTNAPMRDDDIFARRFHERERNK